MTDSDGGVPCPVAERSCSATDTFFVGIAPDRDGCRYALPRRRNSSSEKMMLPAILPASGLSESFCSEPLGQVGCQELVQPEGHVPEVGVRVAVFVQQARCR